jgi:peptide/nickel transport system permease protein
VPSFRLASAGVAGSSNFLLDRLWGHASLRMVIRRLALAIPLLFLVSVSTFFLMSLVPGDPAREILGIDAPQSAYVQLRDQLGLNEPVIEQYLGWARRALHGNLGTSLYSGQSVSSILDSRLAVTVSLVVCSVVVSGCVGVTLGSFRAIRGGITGRLTDAASVIGLALPGFWLGAELVVLFAVKLRWFPATGYVNLDSSPMAWLRSIVLPVAALSLVGVAAVAKQTREATLEALQTESIKMAWASGLPRRSIYLKHILKRLAPRIVTVLGVQAIAMLNGTVFIESVFALPGLGSVAVQAASSGDIPVIQGVAVYFTFMVVVINLIVDLIHDALDVRGMGR